MDTVTLLVALALAALHVGARAMNWIDVVPRSRWLSIAGGVAVAYVFLHILPELGRHQGRLAEEGMSWLGQRDIYGAAFVGLALFYGLERAARCSRPACEPADEPGQPAAETRPRAGRPLPRSGPTADADDGGSAGVFWIHMTAYGLYNVLVAYLIASRPDAPVSEVLLFAFAMGLHFVVNDHGLRHHHRRRYDLVGRWVLAIAVLLGWSLGATIRVGELLVSLAFAFLAGGIVLNVLKEELPPERESRFWPFAAGGVAYAALLLIAE